MIRKDHAEGFPSRLSDQQKPRSHASSYMGSTQVIHVLNSDSTNEHILY